MLSYQNLPDHSRKRKERDEVYEEEYVLRPDYMMELHLARKKQATRLGIHTPLKHDSVFDLSRGRRVRPMSCLSPPRPKQVSAINAAYQHIITLFRNFLYSSKCHRESC
jgi:hypothetical protein